MRRRSTCCRGRRGLGARVARRRVMVTATGRMAMGSTEAIRIPTMHMATRHGGIRMAMGSIRSGWDLDSLTTADITGTMAASMGVAWSMAEVMDGGNA